MHSRLAGQQRKLGRTASEYAVNIITAHPLAGVSASLIQTASINEG